MEIKRDKFLEGLKDQFEESDMMKLNFESNFQELDTWDSLTKFSIIAFVEDEYGIVISPDEFNLLLTPGDLLSFIENKS